MYLKFIKVSSKFIQICDCSHKMCHTYCVTAFVLRKQQIYCQDCLHFYRLYVRSERIFSVMYTSRLVNIVALFMFYGLAIWGLYEIDYYLKRSTVKD